MIEHSPNSAFYHHQPLMVVEQPCPNCGCHDVYMGAQEQVQGNGHGGGEAYLPACCACDCGRDDLDLFSDDEIAHGQRQAQAEPRSSGPGNDEPLAAIRPFPILQLDEIIQLSLPDSPSEKLLRQLHESAIFHIQFMLDSAYDLGIDKVERDVRRLSQLLVDIARVRIREQREYYLKMEARNRAKWLAPVEAPLQADADVAALNEAHRHCLFVLERLSDWEDVTRARGRRTEGHDIAADDRALAMVRARIAEIEQRLTGLGKPPVVDIEQARQAREIPPAQNPLHQPAHPVHRDMDRGR